MILGTLANGIDGSLLLSDSLVLAALFVVLAVSTVALAPSQRDAVRRR